MKQVEFDIELVKKIQNGEVKGCVKTRDGRAARFLGEINNDKYPLIFVYKNIRDNEEYANSYTINGFYFLSEDEDYRDLIIEIEESKQEHQFKPFDKVLARDKDDQLWCEDYFSHLRKDNSFPYVCAGNAYKQCIPYDGNEHLAGTSNKPKED